MTNERDDELSGLLATAVGQLVETPEARYRPADLDAIVLRELSRADDSPNRPISGTAVRRAEKHPLPRVARYTLAASLAIATGAILWFGLAGGTNPVYATVAQRLETLKNIVYRVQWVDEAGLANVVAGDGDKVIHVPPSHDRIERENGTVLVIDTDLQKAIDLDPAAKQARVMNGQFAESMAAMSRGPVRLLDTLRKHFRTSRAMPEGVEALGEREIEGIQAVGLRSTIGGEVLEAWIDPVTNLPVEVRICLDIPANLIGQGRPSVRMWRIISDLEYDIAVDRSLLSVEVPAGYSVFEMPQVATNTAPATLADVVELLRLCARHNDATFPDALSMAGAPGTCMAIMKRFAGSQEEVLQSGTDAEKQAAMKTVMEFGTALGRATRFLASLRPEHKLRYAGAGVKLDAPDKPILWYSPKGNTQYQVVYADLSIKEAGESSLPRLPEAAASPSKAETRTIIRSTSPRVTLPRSAIKDFATLQRIRKAGTQHKVRFLELTWMRELIEGNAAVKADAAPEAARLRFLQEFPNLEGLKVEYLVLTESDLQVIGRLNGLEQLSLSGVQIAEGSGGRHFLRGGELRHLNGLTNLETLDLSQSDFSGGLQHLAGLPKLRTLILSSFEHVNDASLAQLKELPHLQTLVLAGVYGTNPRRTVTDAGLESLQELPSLRTLYVEYHGQWTLPVEKLQALLRGVDVRRGFLEETR